MVDCDTGCCHLLPPHSNNAYRIVEMAYETHNSHLLSAVYPVGWYLPVDPSKVLKTL